MDAYLVFEQRYDRQSSKHKGQRLIKFLLSKLNRVGCLMFCCETHTQEKHAKNHFKSYKYKNLVEKLYFVALASERFITLRACRANWSRFFASCTLEFTVQIVTSKRNKYHNKQSINKEETNTKVLWLFVPTAITGKISESGGHIGTTQQLNTSVHIIKW